MTIVGTILNMIAVALLLSGFLSLTTPAIARQILAGLVYVAAAIAMQIGGYGGTWAVSFGFLASIVSFITAGARHRRLMAGGYSN